MKDSIQVKNAIAETNNFIVLDSYTKLAEGYEQSGYQTEADLEREFIEDLCRQGYEYLRDLHKPEDMLANVRVQLESLNAMRFNDEEWKRFCEEYLDRANDSLKDKSRKIHFDYIYDFVFDDGHIQNIYLVDKRDITRNKLQVISQFEQTGTQANRYDVTILVNGLPLIQIELKKRGVAIREAFNQIHRYSKESFNSDNSLYKYLQIFVISNGTDSRYFANTTKRNKNSFDFTMNWADKGNKPIKDLKDFTATFFQKNTILNILLNYSVYDTSDTLLIMRPYQIAATERILWKIASSHRSKQWSKTESGGYIWHTTGSGKTLTSFKAARLATELEFIDKVFFVVDRKDLDFQTMKEYQRFSPDSVNGSNNTAGLKQNIEKNDNKIIVTTIQKLNNLIKSEGDLAVYKQEVVFIFDECHRSQFGEAQKNIRKKFKKFYQFGFTGTPIFPENALGSETTASVFGTELHSYIITDAIRDEKVLKFKVDYNNVRPQFKSLECEEQFEKLSSVDYKEAMQHPNRIEEVSRYILNKFNEKTHRSSSSEGFNAMFAVSSVESAKLYYEAINKLQEGAEKPLKIATIFSFAANETQNAVGDIEDEGFEPSAMDMSAKEFLTKAIEDYNQLFQTSYNVDSKEFQNYYRDLSKRMKTKEVDLLIVVGMFLTGFDAPCLNTLFVDKNLRYHGLIQAFSRTNRIYNSTKAFGNIVTFRNLERATIDAITLFGDASTKDVILEKSYQEYLAGFTDLATGKACRGYEVVVEELNTQFPDLDEIITEEQKKEFAKLFGEYLRIDNILQNYDEYGRLKAFHQLDKSDEKAVEEFKEKHYLSDEDIQKMSEMTVISERREQDCRSTYNDIREWLREQKKANRTEEESKVDWSDVVFEVELLKSQEINLDYILGLLYDYHKKNLDKDFLIEEARRIIRSSLGNRAKEDLLIDFIKETDFNTIEYREDILEAFYPYARKRMNAEAEKLITEEGLNEEATKRYLSTSLRKKKASDEGTELNEVLPKMSPLNPQYLTKKQTVFEKVSAFIAKFRDIADQVL